MSSHKRSNNSWEPSCQRNSLKPSSKQSKTCKEWLRTSLSSSRTKEIQPSILTSSKSWRSSLRVVISIRLVRLNKTLYRLQLIQANITTSRGSQRSCKVLRHLKKRSSGCFYFSQLDMRETKWFISWRNCVERKVFLRGSCRLLICWAVIRESHKGNLICFKRKTCWPSRRRSSKVCLLRSRMSICSTNPMRQASLTAQ